MCNFFCYQAGTIFHVLFVPLVDVDPPCRMILSFVGRSIISHTCIWFITLISSDRASSIFSVESGFPEILSQYWGDSASIPKLSSHTGRTVVVSVCNAPRKPLRWARSKFVTSVSISSSSSALLFVPRASSETSGTNRGSWAHLLLDVWLRIHWHWLKVWFRVLQSFASSLARIWSLLPSLLSQFSFCHTLPPATSAQFLYDNLHEEYLVDLDLDVWMHRLCIQLNIQIDQNRPVEDIHVWNVFFFLHCRASAKHSRSTTGNMKRTGTNWVQNFHKTIPKTKQTNTNQNRTQPTNQQKPTHKVLWNFAKRCETKVKRLAPLSPSCDLFHHVVILHAIRVIFRCPSCLRPPFLAQAGLSHPARVDVAWAGKCPLWSATSLHNVP